MLFLSCDYHNVCYYMSVIYMFNNTLIYSMYLWLFKRLRNIGFPLHSGSLGVELCWHVHMSYRLATDRNRPIYRPLTVNVIAHMAVPNRMFPRMFLIFGCSLLGKCHVASFSRDKAWYFRDMWTMFG